MSQTDPLPDRLAEVEIPDDAWDDISRWAVLKGMRPVDLLCEAWRWYVDHYLEEPSER